MGPQKKPVGRAPAVFFTGLKAAQGDETKIKTFYANLQMSFFAEVGRKDRGSQQPNTHARAKVTRMKVGKSIPKWCHMFCTD